MLKSFSLVFVLFVMCTPIITAQKNAVQIIKTETDEGLSISAKNDNIYTVTVDIHFVLNNFKATKGNPLTLIIPAKKEQFVTDLLPIDVNKSANMSVKYSFYEGDIFAEHDDKMAYRLPYKRGTKRMVDQGYNGSFSHYGNSKYAIDFNMPEGTEVYAARAGLVTDLQEKYKNGGNNERFLDEANYVSVLHNDGTYAQYSHLMENGAKVRVGQRVKAGELIGYSGSTGFVTGPHLHFVVLKAKKGGGFISLPVKFATKDGIQQLKPKKAYIAY